MIKYGKKIKLAMDARHTNILIELNKTVKTLQFYPEGHPNLNAAIGNFHLVLKRVLQEAGKITWKVDKRGIFTGGEPIAPSHGATAAVSKLLFFRKIKAITFTDAVTEDDIKAFLKILSLEPEEIFALGGVEKIMAGKDSTGILLNEMSYKEMAELKEKMEEEKIEAEKEEIMEEAEKMEEAAEEEAQPPKEAIEAEKEESMEALVERLEKEKDIIMYNDISARIMEKADAVISIEEFDRAFPVLTVFFKHTLQKYAPSEGIRLRAAECLNHLLQHDVLVYLIDKISKKDEQNRALVCQLLIAGGEPAVESLLEGLIGTNDSSARRFIFNTLVYLGERIRGQVEQRLDDERWFVARQMVALLGALGTEKSLEPLERAYTNPDARVKKEVLKNLAKIPSQRSSEILISALKDGDRALIGQAIISLGVMKEHSAVNILGDIALKKFLDDIELQKEAIKALGIIRDKDAIEYLKKLLNRKSWFAKESNEELRTLAAISLGKIGGKEVTQALEHAYKDSSGRLYDTCRKILETMEGNRDDAGHPGPNT